MNINDKLQGFLIGIKERRFLKEITPSKEIVKMIAKKIIAFPTNLPKM